MYVAVDRDKARALGRLREWFGSYYGNVALAERVAVVGDREEVIEALSEVRAVGAEVVLVNPVFDELDHLELLAGEIVRSVE